MEGGTFSRGVVNWYTLTLVRGNAAREGRRIISESWRTDFCARLVVMGGGYSETTSRKVVTGEWE